MTLFFKLCIEVVTNFFLNRGNISLNTFGVYMKGFGFLKRLKTEKSLTKITVDIGGKEYLIQSDDQYLDHIKNGFEPDMVKLFKTLASNSKIILDIGANIGCTSLLFSDLSEIVYAFEPSPTTFALLEKNISNSGKTNIQLQNIGLGDEAYKTTLTFSPTNRSGGFVSNQTKIKHGHTTENIIIQRLDDLFNQLGNQKIDFIKIDVEGFEAKVIAGGKKLIQEYRPIVVLELNHWCLNAFQRTSIPDFFDFLRSIFPVLIAVDKMNYLDLYNENDTYSVMYQHILNMKFPNIIACFDRSQLSSFLTKYKHSS